MSSEAVVREFWRRMATNDFSSVGPLLADDFVLHWPQSGERIRGAARFARVNAEYPVHGRWAFTLERIVAGPAGAVTDVVVTDGVQHARAITFFTLRGGLIERMIEYWPEPFAARPERAHLVERDSDPRLYPRSQIRRRSPDGRECRQSPIRSVRS